MSSVVARVPDFNGSLRLYVSAFPAVPFSITTSSAEYFVTKSLVSSVVDN